mgnify:CR=1 FL=1
MEGRARGHVVHDGFEGHLLIGGELEREGVEVLREQGATQRVLDTHLRFVLVVSPCLERHLVAQELV